MMMIWIVVAMLSPPGAVAPVVATGGPFTTQEICEKAMETANATIKEAGVKVWDSKCVSLGGEAV